MEVKRPSSANEQPWRCSFLRRSSQLALTFAVVCFAAVMAVGISARSHNLLWVWLIAIGMGFTLYRSGLCFASACTDPVLFGDFRMSRAIILLLALSVAGFTLVQISAVARGQALPGYIHPFGVYTMVGGFLFGLGMVLAGGCVVRALQGIGEGSLLFWLVLAGLGLGSLVGAYHLSWWIGQLPSSGPVFLPVVLGWPGSTVLSLGTLAAVYWWTLRRQRKSQSSRWTQGRHPAKEEPTR